MPVFIARWMPFSRCEFRNPAASPAISAPSIAVADHLPASEQFAQPGMSLELLQGVVYVKAWVFVVQSRDQPDGQARVRNGVNESAAELPAAERPACGVDHLTTADAAR